MQSFTAKETIRALVHTGVETFAQGFQARHEGEVDNPEGTINAKIHNVFIEAPGEEIQYYTALVRSLDSSLGNALERIAINIAKLTFEVRHNVEGPLTAEQTMIIADLPEKYKTRDKEPEVFWNYVCQFDEGYECITKAFREIIAEMKFRQNVPEMALRYGLNQYSL
jgi:hypothetical protein